MAAITDAVEDRWILLKFANPLGRINHDLLALIRTKLLHLSLFVRRCPTSYISSLGIDYQKYSYFEIVY